MVRAFSHRLHEFFLKYLLFVFLFVSLGGALWVGQLLLDQGASHLEAAFLGANVGVFTAYLFIVLFIELGDLVRWLKKLLTNWNR
ncbi:MAG: hypothetical protein RBU21_09025 [FCB group bacterium]|jgi:hypothetical protein|nr:hypothetical protein [FCB group bacterium]